MERVRVHDKFAPIDAETMENKKPTIFQVNVQEPIEITKKKKSCSSVASQAAQILLRSLTALCMLAAIIIMLFFTEQTYSVGGYRITASYRSSPAFQFFVVGSAAAGLYSILSIFFACCCPKSKFLHGLDMMVMALTMAAFSAATAVGYIGLNGNDAIGWIKVCNYVERFCSRSTFALGLSFVGFVVHFFVCTLSSA